VFEKQSAGEEAQRATGAGIRPPAPLEGFPDGFDELPIELISLTDRYAQHSQLKQNTDIGLPFLALSPP
jgi:hypothetical protein